MEKLDSFLNLECISVHDKMLNYGPRGKGKYRSTDNTKIRIKRGTIKSNIYIYIKCGLGLERGPPSLVKTIG